MYDHYKIAADILDIIQQIDISRILPHVGVGGEIEAKESVDIEPLIRYSLIFLACMGTIFGFLLAFAAKKFAVKADPLVEKVNDQLAQAHCGACGFAGCEQYAEAVVKDPAISPSLCIPAGERAALRIAVMTGKKAEIKEKQFARIMCGGGLKEAAKKFIYEGVPDCRAAVLAGGGDKTCLYGCLGYGTCERVCPFDAISMDDNGLPRVDMDKCTACGKCVAACPKRVIELIPASKAVVVVCHSRDKAADTRKLCSAGCIACGICVKLCPFDAPGIKNNLSRIDPAKCTVCGLCVTKCPAGAIADFVPRTKAAIDDACIGCGACLKVCPVSAINGLPKSKHVVDKHKCVGCGLCVAKCPVQAIEGTFNAEQALIAKQKARKAS